MLTPLVLDAGFVTDHNLARKGFEIGSQDVELETTLEGSVSIPVIWIGFMGHVFDHRIVGSYAFDKW